MKKRVNKVIILRVLVLVISLFICGLLYLNINYSRQISERDVLINKLMLKDSISSSVLKIQETDTTFIYKVHTDDVGNTLTYDQVDSMAMTYKRELDLKDLILVKAKQHYGFNYSVQEKGDTIIIGWSKK